VLLLICSKQTNSRQPQGFILGAITLPESSTILPVFLAGLTKMKIGHTTARIKKILCITVYVNIVFYHFKFVICVCRYINEEITLKSATLNILLQFYSEQ
jgi:hypothetical protein